MNGTASFLTRVGNDRMRHALLIFLSQLALLPTGQSMATPDPATWRRELVIGCNDNEYAILVTQWSQPGRHDYYSESYSLELRRLADGSLITSHVLSAKTGSTADGARWERASEAQDPAQEQVAHLINAHDLRPIFPSSQCNVVLTSDGLVLRAEDKSAVLIDTETLAHRIAGFDSEARLIGACLHGPRSHATGENHWFHSIVVGAFGPDESGSEIVVGVPGRVLSDAWEEIRAGGQ